MRVFTGMEKCLFCLRSTFGNVERQTFNCLSEPGVVTKERNEETYTSSTRKKIRVGEIDET